MQLRRVVGLAFLFIALWFLSRSALLAQDPAHTSLDKTLRQLEKEISAVRGLEFKKPVVARIIPRPRDTSPRLQGYYSTKEKALYLYDDLKGSYRRGVLIHEMVHALQDQHFGLKKLHATSFSSDADLARAALIEGDATYTMIEMLRKDQPRVAKMLDAPLSASRDIQKAFLYAEGARYVQALKKKGGWEAVNRRYRFPPRSTASILHPEGVSTIDLGPGKTEGELGLIRLLAQEKVTRKQAASLASGWRGDRLVHKGKQKAWTIALASAEKAQRLRAGLARFHQAKDNTLKRVVDEPGETVWHGPEGKMLAVYARDSRVHVLQAPDQASYRQLREQIEGPLSLEITTKKGKPISFGTLVDQLMTADLICIGEQHNSDLHHRVQLQVIKALHARDERLGVGMEMFQKPFQQAMDQYLAGKLGEQEFLKKTEYQKRWGYDWSLYRPVVEFCRRNGVVLAGLNAPRELTRRISRVGFAGLSEKEKKQLGKIDFHVKAHRAHWYERLAQMHGKSKAKPEVKERSYQVMTVWDGFMANSAVHFLKERRLRRMVLLAGSGHIDRWFGIPDRVHKQTGGKVLTIRVELKEENKKPPEEKVADYLIRVR